MSVTVRLLGDFAVHVDGRVIGADGFVRRDAARLVQVLALAPGRRLHREQVLDALWPDTPPDVALNRLHKAAHYARATTGESGAVTLRNDFVSLFPADDVEVDAVVFEASARAVLADNDRAAAESTLSAWGGELLPQEPYASWAFQPRQRVELLHRELLRACHRWVELVALDATDEQAHLALANDMLSHGDRSGALRLLDTLEQTLRHELGIGPSPEVYDLRVHALDTPVSPPATEPAPRYAGVSRQTIGFCRTRDGVRLAYATSGAGPPLVKASNWLTHLDYDWGSPVWSHWWEALSTDRLLVRYDERGCGLSDWDVDGRSFTLDAWVADLETVVDTLGLERFPLLGISQGGPIAITYAHRHPERVSNLVIFGTCARAVWDRASETERRELAALGQLMRVSWGVEQPGFRQVYNARFLPDGPLELWRAFDELQRRTTSAQNAHRLWRAFGSLDASAAARALDVPTLILHSRDDLVWSFDEAEELHSMIAGSQLVPLDSRNHILQADEPAFAVLIAEVRRFLATT
jgi:pimeloyl-ACP methyl ester carboxylesterase/DNA-binding SARP family transcriptional activator